MFAHFLTNKVPKQMAAFLGQMFTLYAENFSHKTFLGKHYLWANRELFHTRTPVFSKYFPHFTFPQDWEKEQVVAMNMRSMQNYPCKTISSGGFPFCLLHWHSWIWQQFPLSRCFLYLQKIHSAIKGEWNILQEPGEDMNLESWPIANWTSRFGN